MADLRADRHLDGLPDARSASIASTLCVPLFIAAIGIVMRGAAYALRAGRAARASGDASTSCSRCPRCSRRSRSARSSAAIASRRVPVGNAAGDLFSSWLNPTSMIVGALARRQLGLPRRRLPRRRRASASARRASAGRRCRGLRALRCAGAVAGADRLRRARRAALRRAFPLHAPAARRRARRRDRLGAGRPRNARARARAALRARPLHAPRSPSPP